MIKDKTPKPLRGIATHGIAFRSTIMALPLERIALKFFAPTFHSLFCLAGTTSSTSR